MPSSADAPLAVALGANRPSAAGNPRQTLISVRPRLEAVIGDWARQSLRFRWSALLDTAPVGPVDQPRYLNGVLLVEGIPSEPNQAAALCLLDDLHALERHFGRDRAGELDRQPDLAK